MVRRPRRTRPALLTNEPPFRATYQLRPISCTPLVRDRDNDLHYGINDVLGNYSLTLIDSLSTLAILASSPADDPDTGRHALADFQDGIAQFVKYYGDGRPGRSGEGLRARGFDLDSKVQVFETVIRGVGGLLSAHLFAIGELPITGYSPGKSAGRPARDDPLELNAVSWPNGLQYDGQLLRLALDLGQRLLPAFYTNTGLPYPRVNLRHGVPFYANSPLNDNAGFESAGGPQEKTETCSAGAGSLVLEFTTLSRLTGDARFEQLGKRAFWEVWDRRSDIGLVGNRIDPEGGHWLDLDTGIGAGVDSFFEYALKSHILLSGQGLPNMTMPEPSPGRRHAWLDPNSLYPPLSAQQNSPDAFLQAWHKAHAAAQGARGRQAPPVPRGAPPALHNRPPADRVARGRVDRQPRRLLPGPVGPRRGAGGGDRLQPLVHGPVDALRRPARAMELPRERRLLRHRLVARPARVHRVDVPHLPRDQGPVVPVRGRDGPEGHHEEVPHRVRLVGPPGRADGREDGPHGELLPRRDGKYMYLLFDPDHPLNKLDAAYVFTTEGHPLIIPRNAAARARSREFAANDDVSVYYDENYTNACPAAPAAIPLSISATASRADIFHASSFANLHFTPNIHGEIELVETEKPDKGAKPKYRAKTNYTYFPWTLPTDMMPQDGVCAVLPGRQTLSIEFPADAPNDGGGGGSGSAFNQVFGSQTVSRFGHQGLYVHSLSGLRLMLVLDDAIGLDYDHTWRVTSVNNIALGRDEQVFFEAALVAGMADPLFNRVRHSSHVDVVFAHKVDLSQQNSSSHNSSSSNASDQRLTDRADHADRAADLTLQDLSDKVEQLIEEAKADMPQADYDSKAGFDGDYKALFKSLVRAVTNVFEPIPASTSSSSSPSSSDSQQSDDDRPATVGQSYLGALPVGKGAVLPPDVADAPAAASLTGARRPDVAAVADRLPGRPGLRRPPARRGAAQPPGHRHAPRRLLLLRQADQHPQLCAVARGPAARHHGRRLR